MRYGRLLPQLKRPGCLDLAEAGDEQETCQQHATVAHHADKDIRRPSRGRRERMKASHV